ncbi:DNA helicase/exodeoxyribonuclease V, alpha subunit [Allopseudospirillum japonicum]|uniref:RecBCD enzyme subunit RecD n=1 Tax=Allopseudospirillum japonicum TaxID=64971 RepID=A0A1H6SJL9_9GAMM|nr:exodeoxyribonuclease V subunit alpha [Allopseudospirillum japonicum]SEI64200.1 DNA helicase/exodeoxyribonuclease V, alpha subunit [Allopseudospirillum japonicum]
MDIEPLLVPHPKLPDLTVPPDTDFWHLLDTWVEAAWLRAVDLGFAHFLAKYDPQAPASVLLAAVLTSHQLGRGHVCLLLDETLAHADFTLSLPPEQGHLSLQDPLQALPPLPSDCLASLDLNYWQGALQKSSLVDSAQDAQIQAPLVLAETRLYLQRYWRYEYQVAQHLHTRMQIGRSNQVVNKALLDALFPMPVQRPHKKITWQTLNWQKMAVALASSQAVTFITGGPGTGKTTTVVRLLALLYAQNPHTHVCLAAPTGKAAARLTESIGSQLTQLAQQVPLAAQVPWSQIPTQVTTLHQLLGARPHSRQFKYHAQHLLAVDVLILDEASMIDLEMFAAVLNALPKQARIILLGDPNQLASVEAGAVLGELCKDAASMHYQMDTVQYLQASTGEPLDQCGLTAPIQNQYPLSQHLIMLHQTYRFAANTGIGKLADAVQRGAYHSVRYLLREHDDLALIQLTKPDPHSPPSTHPGAIFAAQAYRTYLQQVYQAQPTQEAPADAWDTWALACLQAFEAFRLLAVVREGIWGVTYLNTAIAHCLAEDAQTPLTWQHLEQTYYLGRPLMLTRNDYRLGLMNGDIGLCLQRFEHTPSQPEGRYVTRVVFQQAQGGLHWVLPSRLQEVETAYVLTVHKAQGSEFAHTALILPQHTSPLLTRELLYTGITRAKTRFSLLTSRPQAIRQALTQKVVRHSGLYSYF